MVARIRQIGTAKPKASDIERLSSQVARAELDHGDSLAEVVRAERTLQESMLAALETADDVSVSSARKALRQARENADDLAQLVKGLQTQHDRMRRNHEAAQYARRLQEARAQADRMTAALLRLTEGADLIAAAAVEFHEARDRLRECSPVALPYVPAPWANLERLVQRHIGSRSPVFRSAALASGEIEALGHRNEILTLHADALAQLFGPNDPPPAKAA